MRLKTFTSSDRNNKGWVIALLVLGGIAHVFFSSSGCDLSKHIANNNKVMNNKQVIEDPPPPPQCTPSQLDKISQQLPSDQCIANELTPWNSRCSFSAASSCPESVWLERFFGSSSTTTTSTTDHTNEEEEPFLSFFVGCNKAIDAVNALRMGSRNPDKFNVDQWKETLSRGNSNEFAGSSCAQFEREGTTTMNTNTNTRTNTHATSNTAREINTKHRHAQVYCFEPVTTTFSELSRTKLELGWTNELILEEAAVSSQSGSISVPKETALGTENKGIDVMNCGGDPLHCRDIPIYTLNDYVTALPHKPHIHFLSIDVEGYDFEVLKGASNILSDQVHYLEFEYNWKGPWGKQRLKDAIDLLHNQHGFTCYWPGRNGHIWRITNCWLDHYGIRYWANVACVNNHIPQAQPLAQDMERAFLETIQIEGLVYQRTTT